MGLTITTAPSYEPVTLAEARQHCRIDAHDDDEYLSALISVARGYVEDETNRALMPHTLALTLDEFPADAIELPRAPLQSVTSITYIDLGGTVRTWSATEYQVIATEEPGRIVPAYGYCWPSIRGQPAAVTVTYKAGYSTALDGQNQPVAAATQRAAVPMRLKQAVLLVAAHLYVTREPVNVGNITSLLPLTIDALLAGVAY